MHLPRKISTFALLGLAMPTTTLVGQSSQTVSRAEATKAIEDGNITWGKARVAIDKNAFERMLEPDLYVQLSDRRLTRATVHRSHLLLSVRHHIDTIRFQRSYRRTEWRRLGGENSLENRIRTQGL